MGDDHECALAAFLSRGSEARCGVRNWQVMRIHARCSKTPFKCFHRRGNHMSKVYRMLYIRSRFRGADRMMLSTLSSN